MGEQSRVEHIEWTGFCHFVYLETPLTVSGMYLEFGRNIMFIFVVESSQI